MQSNHLYALHFVIDLEMWCVIDDICLINGREGKWLDPAAAAVQV